MFETKAELAELQRLLDASFERSGERRLIFDASNRLTAGQLSGFQGVRLVAIATVNSSGEPRAAPRSAAFLHGKFFLAANTESVMVRRLSNKPALGVTYFENQLLIVGHGTATPFRRGSSGFDALLPEWEKAFRGGAHSLDGIDILVRVDAANMLAFADRPERYPKAWRTPAR
jgi:Pyridoxamine 5'-phosphate oxidase